MRHGREESGRLGFRGQLTRRHRPPFPSPLSPPPPSLSDEATSPLMPPPPRDAALLRLTPPRRTGCHLLRPVEATQFAVRHRARTEVLISENDEDDEERLTPLSLGSKRSTSSRSKASSPNKKTKNQAIWDTNQREANDIKRQKVNLIGSILEIQQKRKQQQQQQQQLKDQKIEKVYNIALGMGITAATKSSFLAIRKICHSEVDLAIFLACTDDAARWIIINENLPDVEDLHVSSDDEPQQDEHSEVVPMGDDWDEAIENMIMIELMSSPKDRRT